MWLIPTVVRAVSLTFMLILEIWLSPKSEGPSAKKTQKYYYFTLDTTSSDFTTSGSEVCSTHPATSQCHIFVINNSQSNFDCNI